MPPLWTIPTFRVDCRHSLRSHTDAPGFVRKSRGAWFPPGLESPCSTGANWVNDSKRTYTYIPITEIERLSAVIHTFSLSNNYPNPFNPTTTIKYQIPKTNLVILKVYDVLGKEVVTLVNEEKPMGKYEVKFEAKGLPSGIYFFRIQAGDFQQVKKMVLMK